MQLQLAPTFEAYSVRRQSSPLLFLPDAMIEQPRLAALGIAIMVLGVLWMGLPYLCGSGSESADDRPNEESPPAPVVVEEEGDTEDNGGSTDAQTDRTIDKD